MHPAILQQLTRMRHPARYGRLLGLAVRRLAAERRQGTPPPAAAVARPAVSDAG